MQASQKGHMPAWVANNTHVGSKGTQLQQTTRTIQQQNQLQAGQLQQQAAQLARLQQQARQQEAGPPAHGCPLAAAMPQQVGRATDALPEQPAGHRWTGVRAAYRGGGGGIHATCAARTWATEDSPSPGRVRLARGRAPVLSCTSSKLAVR
jgi:type II secretory pathway pseudopilin PulG